MNAEPSGFEPTRWTLVMQAKGEEPEARKALADLCDRYYQPVFVFLRREEGNEDKARECTHEFFELVLAGGFLKHVEPGRGRFRSYLLGALKHFLSHRRASEQAAKRGGGVIHQPFDEDPGTDAGVHVRPPSSSPPGDALFDREWAFALIGRALDLVEDEMAKAGKADNFNALKPWLDGAGASSSDAAESLGMTESALRVAIHRLRQRFRRRIQREVAQTVAREEDIPGELNHLIEIVAESGMG